MDVPLHSRRGEPTKPSQVRSENMCTREPSWVENFDIFHAKNFHKINLNFSHIFHCRHIVNLQNELLILSLSCNACTGHVHQIFFFFRKKNRACKIFENSHLPPTGSLSSILIITATELFCLSLNVERDFFTTFSSGLERRLEASVSLLIGIFTVDSFFWSITDCVRALSSSVSPLSAPHTMLPIENRQKNCYFHFFL